jgi:hypothetical protein
MKALLVLSLFAFTLGTHARDLHVDPTLGNDASDGEAKPVKTIARGLKLAQPGDTVHLAPVVFKESAVFYNRAGEPGKPITLDGHGATLDGGEPLSPDDWTETAPGLFRCDHLLRLDDAIIQRWFFVWDGKMNHMGRTSKGPRTELKKPEELQPGEWTYVKDAAAPPEDKRLINGAFFIKLPPGQKLADAKIVAPMRSAGVQFSGTNKHLVIRNLTATHVYNDGFNIHGHCEDVLFENIRAIECGDDGISAHETAQYRVNGFVAIGNSTGICDTGASVTSYDHVFIRDCLGAEVMFLDTGRYALRNAVVLSSAWRTFALSGRAEAPASLTMENVFIRRRGTPSEMRISSNAVLTARRCTFLNLTFHATNAQVELAQSVLAGEPSPELIIGKEVKWTARANLYSLRSLRLDTASFTPQTFADFQKLSGDTDSQWRSIPVGAAIPAGVGADLASLEADVVPTDERAAWKQP